jgi:hypothetical protein
MVQRGEFHHPSVSSAGLQAPFPAHHAFSDVGDVVCAYGVSGVGLD